MSAARAGRRRLSASVLAIAALLAVVAACSGGGDDASTDTSAPTTTTTVAMTTTVPLPLPTYPLTGLTRDDPAKATRPGTVVKIENSSKSQGRQRGVTLADVVYVEKVEGGITRLATVFHSTDAEAVGPVRSARTTDVVLTANLNRPLFAYSGANAGVLRQIRGANLVDLGRDTRPDMYNGQGILGVFTSTPTLYGAAPDPPSGPPGPLFVYGPTPPGAPATGATASYGSMVDTKVRWETWEGGWMRSQDGAAHVDQAGARVGAANVVFQMVEYRDSGFRDITGAASPEAVLLGEGDVLVLTGGRLVPGRWSRAAPGDVTTLTTATGRPLALQPGRTWVELVPQGSVAPL